MLTSIAIREVFSTGVLEQIMNDNNAQRLGTGLLGLIAVVLGPNVVLAHTGGNPAHDLLHGLQHPVSGLDHILARFAVGMWAAQRGGRALWLVPLTFVGVMMIGGAIGMAGVSIPFVEQGIVLSVIILGVLVAAAVRLPLAVSAAIAGCFAIAHGYAHGAEIPSTASGVSYALGFAASTLVLVGSGVAFGLGLQRIRYSQLIRLAGAATAICGLYLGIR